MKLSQHPVHEVPYHTSRYGVQQTSYFYEEAKVVAWEELNPSRGQGRGGTAKLICSAWRATRRRLAIMRGDKIGGGWAGDDRLYEATKEEEAGPAAK